MKTDQWMLSNSSHILSDEDICDDLEGSTYAEGPKKEGIKDVLNATFDDLCDASPELFKISEIAKSNKKIRSKILCEHLC
ncbi:unnamed protein product [Arctia plantaginis]|uniref:Uncharacterized protein n=1 Tax=Arctia plantaginis TaxID=874455 RepID=A0A8S1BSW8_ARCPL|nr:unnamed protein product [Arctia plantaginis]